MKPLQFYQYKKETDRKRMVSCRSTTHLTNELKKIQKSQSLSAPKTRRAIAEGLTEYYSILFNPQYRNYFRPLKDLSLLFPTKEVISISPDTNFLLLPLPLPTYELRTLHGNYHRNCPILKPSLATDEFVRDIDYSIDTDVSKIVNTKGQNQRGQYRKLGMYQHTNGLLKAERALNPLKGEARIWTYQYMDFPNYIAKHFDTYPDYSFSDKLDDFDPEVIERKKKSKSMRVYFRKVGEKTEALEVKSDNFIRVKYTFLEIPNQTNSNLVKKYYHLNEYSRQMLVPNLLDEKFPTYFDFVECPKEAIIRYFMKYALPMNEFNPIQIRTGIKRLKDIIKFTKPNQSINFIQHDQPIQEPIQEPNKKGRPSRDYLNTHGVKWYKPDGTVVEFETYDTKSLYRQSKEELTNLYSNKPTTGSQE